MTRIGILRAIVSRNGFCKRTDMVILSLGMPMSHMSSVRFQTDDPSEKGQPCDTIPTLSQGP